MSSNFEGGLFFIVLDDRTMIVYHAISKELVMQTKLKKDQTILSVACIEDYCVDVGGIGPSLPKEFRLALSANSSKVPLLCMVV